MFLGKSIKRKAKVRIGICVGILHTESGLFFSDSMSGPGALLKESFS